MNELSLLEIDAKISELVYGHTEDWAVWQLKTQRYGKEITKMAIMAMQRGHFRYSSLISDAYDLINKLAKDGYSIRISNKSMDGTYWWAYLDSPDGKSSCSQGSSIPHSLCLAVIKLYDIDTEDKI